MKIDAVHFSDRDFDDFFGRWLAGALSTAEQSEWNHILMFNTKFREDFCDFIKSLREPAWAKTAQLRSQK